MKRIVNGKMYDTETAKCLGNWNTGFGNNDFNNYSESLYCTKKGVYFLAGEGGPLSKYAEHCGNNSSGGENIILFDEIEAKEWAEKHLSPEKYIDAFGVPPEA